MKRNTLFYILIALLFAFAGAYLSISHTSQDTAQTPPSDQSAALLLAQTLPDSAGKMQDLSQWKGKKLIVNFWATWCAPCVEEMPELSAMQAHLLSQNIQIIGIGIDSAENIGVFASKYNIAYPLYVAGMNGAELARRMGNANGGVPYTLLISADGKIKKKYFGKLKFDELKEDLRSVF